MHSRMTILSVVIGGLLPGSLQIAYAVDGVKLINQSEALAGGVTPGDAPGFPVTISQSGSYRLASNLIVPDEKTTAIQIAADNVTLDLNGFSILGPTVCLGRPTTCKPVGGGTGVDADDAESITVVNGTVRGMGSDGVRLFGSGFRVERVFAASNGRNGILTGAKSSLIDNTASDNGRGGVIASSFSIASGNVAVRNGSVGVSASTGSTVRNNTAGQNGRVGILAGINSALTGNSATDNGSHGITVSGLSTVVGNSAWLNAGYGLHLGSDSGYTQNVLNINALGSVFGGTSLGQNLCDGAAC